MVESGSSHFLHFGWQILVFIQHTRLSPCAPWCGLRPSRHALGEVCRAGLGAAQSRAFKANGLDLEEGSYIVVRPMGLLSGLLLIPMGLGKDGSLFFQPSWKWCPKDSLKSCFFPMGYPSIYLSIHPSFHPLIHLNTHPFTHLSNYPWNYPFVQLSTYPSIHH